MSGTRRRPICVPAIEQIIEFLAYHNYHDQVVSMIDLMTKHNFHAEKGTKLCFRVEMSAMSSAIDKNPITSEMLGEMIHHLDGALKGSAAEEAWSKFRLKMVSYYCASRLRELVCDPPTVAEHASVEVPINEAKLAKLNPKKWASTVREVFRSFGCDASGTGADEVISYEVEKIQNDLSAVSKQEKVHTVSVAYILKLWSPTNLRAEYPDFAAQVNEEYAGIPELLAQHMSMHAAPLAPPGAMASGETQALQQTSRALKRKLASEPDALESALADTEENRSVLAAAAAATAAAAARAAAVATAPTEPQVPLPMAPDPSGAPSGIRQESIEEFPEEPPALPEHAAPVPNMTAGQNKPPPPVVPGPQVTEVKPPSMPRKRRRWTDEEEAKLRAGQLKYPFKWSIIKAELFQDTGRTVVDLKDKWRNLMRLEGKTPRGDPLHQEAPPKTN